MSTGKGMNNARRYGDSLTLTNSCTVAVPDRHAHDAATARSIILISISISKMGVLLPLPQRRLPYPLDDQCTP
jgi:hypothetical protein